LILFEIAALAYIKCYSVFKVLVHR